MSDEAVNGLIFAISLPFYCFGIVILLCGHVIVAAIATRIAGQRQSDDTLQTKDDTHG